MASGTLAVVGQTSRIISWWALATGERTANMTDLLAEPHELCYDSKRNLLYVSHAYRNGHFWIHGDCSYEISVIDPIAKKVIDTIDLRPALSPHGLFIDTERDLLYCSFEVDESGGTGGLLGIDLNTRKVAKTILSGAKTHWFVMTPDGKKAFTCNKTAHFISVLDVENERMIGKIHAPGTEEPAISKDGKFVYFPTPGATESPENPKILVIDTATAEVVKELPLKHGAQSVHVTADEKLMVGMYRWTHVNTNTEATPERGILATYNLKTYEAIGEAEVGVLPLTLKSSPDASLGFVANIAGGTVSVIDLASMKEIRTLGVDPNSNLTLAKGSCQGAHGMVFFETRI